MANRYWVGGTDNWNGTAGSKWALTSGGAGGQAEPTAADDVFFDGNSGAVTVTVATTTGLALNLNTTGFTGTLAGSTGITVTGNLTLGSGMTWTNTGTLTLNATATTQVLTTNGVALTCSITRSGAGGACQLSGNLTTGVTRAFTLTNGDLDLNGAVLSVGFCVGSASNTISITPNGGSITLTGNAGNIWNFPTNASFSLTAELTVTCNYSGAVGTRTLISGNFSEANSVNFSITAGTDAVTTSSNGVVRNLNFTGFAGTLNTGVIVLYGSLTLGSGMTVVASANDVTFGATSGTKVITTNGVAFPRDLVFNGVGGTFQLADTLTQGASRTLAVTNGTLDLNGFKITGGLMTVDDTAAAGGGMRLAGAGGLASG